MKFDCYRCGETVDQPNTHEHLCLSCVEVQGIERFKKICPPIYQSSDPARLPADHFDTVMRWQYGPRGLLLQGASGVCKTRCAWLLLGKLLKAGHSVTAFDCVGFGHEVSSRFRAEDGRPEAWLESLASREVVFFDDLGKLRLTDRAEAELFGLIERRCANQKPIIATTNDDGDSLADRMTDNRGPAMIRRLREFCDVVRF